MYIYVCIATYMRQIVMDQKLNEKPQPITAKLQTESPTAISLNGFTLQNLRTIIRTHIEIKSLRPTWHHTFGIHYMRRLI